MFVYKARRSVRASLRTIPNSRMLILHCVNLWFTRILTVARGFLRSFPQTKSNLLIPEIECKDGQSEAWNGFSAATL